ncbi:MAG TPA: integrase [Hydrogenophaga sp.]|mgnify:CR=1 FL=1|uniref:integrase n=1 Tax=Hydrogenophaga sp. TaxID=1904254 RepID=UPI002D12E6CB|nr:integrase [Hydrogenophaga sp.]HMN92396.1 integrase [Hydrogenophaga sp.]HMP12027.1 integrase [Hydrogenophaga sp.]
MDVKTPGQIIATLAPGQFTRLTKVIPSGSLEARKLASGGTMLYWRVTVDGKTLREPVGVYDPSASPKSLKPTERGYSVKAAERAAEALAQRHHEHREQGGHVALKASERSARASAAAAAEDARKYTLETLLTDYCDHLEALGRRAHKDARSVFKKHIFEPWPAVAALPARDVTAEQVADMMRRSLELGKGRTANKLRSYVRAAYQTAKAARSKASIPVRFKSYQITSNPAADTEPDESANKADKRPLTAEELRTYWSIIKAMPGFKGAVLRLHLLTGGQRIEQLVNLRTENVSGTAIMLFDGKGRPGKPPRPHTIPLIPAAASALLECRPQGTYALSTDKGETHLAATTLSAWAVEAAGDQIAEFRAKRVRSGVETLLAGARISSEIRGRLQSHGISGVQARHYDGHDYMDEKRQALETLHRLLTAPKSGKVVPFKAA